MKKNRKGFTLAELLIVVAIMAVLVAVAMPVFTGKLAEAQKNTTAANLRAAYVEATTKYLDDNSQKTVTIDNVVIKGTDVSGIQFPFNFPDSFDESNLDASKKKVIFDFTNEDAPELTAQG